MKYFRLEYGLSNRNTEVYIDDIEDEEYSKLRLQLSHGMPIDRWPKGLFAVSSGDPRDMDFLPGLCQRLFISQNARQVLTAMGELPLQFLPVKIGETPQALVGTYFILHVTAVCSSLDLHKTRHDISEISGRVVIIGKNKKTVTLAPAKLVDITYSIYREKNCESLLILREDLVDRLHEAGLKGLQCEEVRIACGR